MRAEFQAELMDMLTRSAAQFSEDASRKLLDALLKAQYLPDSNLKQSIKTDTFNAAKDLMAGILLEFEDYGRINEMKNPLWKKGAPVDVLAEWVKRIGIEKFQYVPGYKYGQFPLRQSAAINRIAWGISRARVLDKTFARRRVRQWFNKTFYKSLNPLLDELARKYTTLTGQQIALQFDIK